MQLLLSSPFRTKVNLKSLKAVQDTKILKGQLNTLISRTTLSFGSLGCEHLKDSKDSSLKYTGLDDDCLSITTSPLFFFDIDPEKLNDISTQQDILNQGVSIKKCTLQFFDNTIAIAIVELSIESSVNSQELLQQIDQTSTKLIEHLIKKISLDIKKIETNVTSLFSKKSLFLHPNDFQVITDINKSEHIESHSKSILWVTRVLFVKDKGIDMEEILLWTQQSNLNEEPINIDKNKIYLFIGNSFVIGEHDSTHLASIQRTLSICTYFYVTYDVLNSILKQSFVQLSSTNSKHTNFPKIAALKNHVEFIKSEYLDLALGLQGYRSLIAKRLFKIWRQEQLINSVNQKQSSISEAIELKETQKRSKYTKIVETILSVIGGLTIFEFTINLLSFSYDEKIPNDNILGLTDLVLLASADAILYGVAAFFIIIILMIIKTR